MTETRGPFATLVRLVVQLIILSVINLILIELPMLKALTIPGSPVTIPAVISFVIGIIMIVVLIGFKQDFIPGLRQVLPGFPQAPAIASSAVILGIIVTAYTMFEAMLRPLLFQFAWSYPLIFLIFALWPLYTLITALYSSSRPIADWAAEKIVQGTANDQVEVTKCASCGNIHVRNAKFCPACGVCLVPQTENNVNCKACGTANKSSYKYCLNCGALIEEDQYETRVSV